MTKGVLVTSYGEKFEGYDLERKKSPDGSGLEGVLDELKRRFSKAEEVSLVLAPREDVSYDRKDVPLLFLVHDHVDRAAYFCVDYDDEEESLDEDLEIADRCVFYHLTKSKIWIRKGFFRESYLYQFLKVLG